MFKLEPHLTATFSLLGIALLRLIWLLFYFVLRLRPWCACKLLQDDGYLNIRAFTIFLF